jgi:tetratricopeptide (TPR) repeat protein
MPKRPSKKPSASGVGVERAANGQTWVLVHPACARECADDLEEVRAMIAAGEADVAIDELRWLLEVCRDAIEAHYLLGKLAVEAQQDLALGRAHFGYGYQLGAKALDRASNPTPLSPLHPANRPFFDAGRGLAWCLAELGILDKAREVIERLRACDPSDPLNLAAWLDELNMGGKPIVELG